MWNTIPNSDPGLFRHTIVTASGKVIAQVLAQRFVDHVKAPDDPEADRYAALLKTAPRLLAALRLTVAQLRASSVAWAEPIDEAEAAIAEAESRT